MIIVPWFDEINTKGAGLSIFNIYPPSEYIRGEPIETRSNRDQIGLTDRHERPDLDGSR